MLIVLPKINIADKLQSIERMQPDGFFQKVLKLENNTDANLIDRDSPAIIPYDKKIL